MLHELILFFAVLIGCVLASALLAWVGYLFGVGFMAAMEQSFKKHFTTAKVSTGKLEPLDDEEPKSGPDLPPGLKGYYG